MNSKIKQLPDGPYNPELSEPEILNYWLENKFYKPETAKQILSKRENVNPGQLPKFTLVNPPPNAYARPHIGNVSGYSYQDVFGRQARMAGNATLLFPGKDHAAQQAEIVYIRDVLTPQGKKKEDFSREEFYAEAYKYFTGIMEIAQRDEQRIGLSADFDRDIFTLDPRVKATVLSTFSKLWEEQMVYKGVRIVNWSPGLQSAVADIDTERQTVKSKMYYLKYALPGSQTEILKIKDAYKNKIISAEVLEVNEITKPENYKSKNIPQLSHLKIKIDGTEKWLWYSDIAETGSNVELKIIGLLIPVKGEVELIAGNVSNEQISPEQYEFIFKYATQHQGSSFIKLFSDEVQTEASYARGFILGTVRPETKFGDTAIAMNPKDERYLEFEEQNLELLSLNGAVSIRMISDPNVDPKFGTGLVKVTPAHSATDYQMYLDYNHKHPNNPIGYKNVIEKNGMLNRIAGVAEGMHAETDREKIAEMFTNEGLIVYTEEAESNITICERTKTIIQPIMSSQWFIDTDRLKVPAIEAVENGQIKVYPEYMTKKLSLWLQNLRDWPISRSIWWGYRIPVWYKGGISETTDAQGQIAVEVGGVQINDMADGLEKGVIKLMLDQDFAPILIPGKYAPENSTYYAELKKKYPWAQIVHTGAIDQEATDYQKAFAKVKFTPDSVVVAHSLGAPAILDYLLEHKLKIARLILLSPSNKDAAKYSEYKQKGFWKHEAKLPEVRDLVEKIDLIYSDNDDHYPGVESFEHLGEQLGAEMILESGKKHFVTDEYYYASERLEQILESEYKKAQTSYAQKLESMQSEGWQQDEDVFDTWFSSGQWPFATLEAEGMLEYYPTSVMETGYDILELWVSRMIMLGLYAKGDIPFSHVYLHGLIKGEDGQKMSKSKGNIVYTEDIIAEYGADTLRMLYIVGNKAGASYKVDRVKLKGYRNFLNKIWNGSRFVLSNIASLDDEQLEKMLEIEAGLSLAQNKLEAKIGDYRNKTKEELAAAFAENSIDELMLSELKHLTEQMNQHFSAFRIGMGAEELYQNFWHVFADIYIEKVKSRLFTKDREGNPINTSLAEQNSRLLALAVLLFSLKTYLKLLHPYIPFVTEKVWQHLPAETKETESLMYAKWPRN